MNIVSNGIVLKSEELKSKNGKDYIKCLVYEGGYITTLACIFFETEDYRKYGVPGEGEHIEIQGRIWEKENKSTVFWNRYRLIRE